MSARALLGFAALLCVAVLLRGGLPPYDDAFFFTRLAANHAQHGVWAWNPADGPVHGNTSQLQQLAVAALHALAPSHTIALGRVVSAGALAGAAILLGRAAPLPALLGFGAPVAIATVFSGMETALALLIGSAWLVCGHAGLRVGLGVLLYLARPDAALLPAVTLALTVLVDDRRRGAAAAELAAMLAGVGAVLLVLDAVYGSALPLSFYLKSGLSDVYDAAFLAKSQTAGRRHLLFFALSAAPLVYLGRSARRWLVPALVFVAYHAVSTVDVMGLHGRFYAPCLPWLVWAAVQARPPAPPRTLRVASGVWAAAVAVVVALELVPAGKGWPIGQVPWPVYTGFVAAVLAGAWAPGRRLVLPALAVSVLLRPGSPGLASDVVYAERLAGMVTSWRGLAAVRECLPADIGVFHSEIGVPGVLLPDAHITDLGGLMTPGPLDAEALCLDRRPDALFLPHRNYAALNAQLREGRCLAEGYVQVVERGSSPLFVRRDRLEAYRCGVSAGE